MRTGQLLAAVAIGAALLAGGARGAGKAPAKGVGKQAAQPAEAVPVAEPLRWKPMDTSPGWVQENVARFEKERTTGLAARWAALQRFRKEMAGKSDAESKRQLAVSEERFANLVSGDGVPPVGYAITMDPKEYEGKGPAYGSCYVTIVKVLGDDKVLADVRIGVRSKGVIENRVPDGDVTNLPLVRAVVRHPYIADSGKWRKPGYSTGYILEKAGTTDVDGQAYPFLRYPDITPWLVPVK